MILTNINNYKKKKLHTTVKFFRNEDFNMYLSIGLGINVLQNWTRSNFSGTIPLGATYYVNSKKLLAIIGECGLKISALDFIKIKTYALIGLQISLRKN